LTNRPSQMKIPDAHSLFSNPQSPRSGNECHSEVAAVLREQLQNTNGTLSGISAIKNDLRGVPSGIDQLWNNPFTSRYCRGFSDGGRRTDEKLASLVRP